MGKQYATIDDSLQAFVRAQHVFFVATAPSGDAGHVNCSPKGLDSFRVISPREVAYLDFVGSGIETVAHARENGRIVIMFCAFEGPPKILRFHGSASTIVPSDAEFDPLFAHFDRNSKLGVRAIVRVDVTRISDSCGFGVPLYRYEGPREQLPAWAARKGEAALESYKRDKNARSIDGLPGLDARPTSAIER